MASHSRNAEFKRVCQPGPRRLKAFRTSASNLMFTCCLGSARTGLPRLGLNIVAASCSPKSSGKICAAGLALANHSACSSGVSSSRSSGLGLRFIPCNFPVVGLPKTDHMNRRNSRRKQQYMESVSDIPNGLKPLLAIVLPKICCHQRCAPVQAKSKPKRYASLHYVPCVFGRVEGDKHPFYCTHINLRLAREPPNPSLKRSANGRPPGPGPRYGVHFLSPGPGVLPLAPA